MESFQVKLTCRQDTPIAQVEWPNLGLGIMAAPSSLKDLSITSISDDISGNICVSFNITVSIRRRTGLICI